jgi:tetratricopeptide (TPR) repeat protein/glycosyltransferase involved in cell wall biosynthesis
MPGCECPPTAVRVTAVVSTYDSAVYFKGCLQDLVEQTEYRRGGLEVVVVDSGSTQGEREIAHDYQRRFANITYLRTAERETVYAAWNRGIRAARGRYVTNANTDDRHRPDAFERMAAVLDERPDVALVYADALKTRTDNETFERCTPTGRFQWYDWDRIRLLTQGCFIGPQPMWRRSVHDLYGYFEEGLVSSGDYEFWLRISQTLDFHHIREPLGLYLENPASIEHRHRDRKRSEDGRIFRDYHRAARSGEVIRSPVADRLRRCAEEPGAASAAGLSELLDRLEQIGGPSFRFAHCGPDGALVTDFRAQLVGCPRPPVLPRELCDLGIRLVLENSSWFKRYRNAFCIIPPSKRAIAATAPGCAPTGGQTMSTIAHVYHDMQPVLQNSRPADAMRALQNLVRSFPDFAPAHNDLGILYCEAGDTQKAGGHLERAVAIAPGEPEYKKNLADFYHVRMSRTLDALALYLEVLQARPNDVLTLLTAAHMLVGLRRCEEARDHYRRVLDIEPWNQEAKENLARLLDLGPGRETAASDPETRYAEIRRLAEKGDGRVAREQLEAFVAAHPRHARAHNDLGVLCYQSGEKEKALRHYEEAARLQPDDRVFRKNLADFYYVEQRRIKEAMQIYVRLLEEQPEDVETLMAIAHICVSLSGFEDAATFYRRVLDIEPWNADAQAALDRIAGGVARDAAVPTGGPQSLYEEAARRIGAGDVRSGKEMLLQLAASHPDVAIAHNDLGVLAYQEGDRQSALEHYQKAVRLEPLNLTFRKNLAECQWIGFGRHEEALKTYIDILSSHPEDVETLIGLGQLCTELRQYDDARAFLERVLEIEPWNSGAHDRLAALNSAAKAA